MNKIIISGNIVGNSEKAPKMYTYYKGNDDKKSVVNFFVSVIIPHTKKEENGYYPSDLHPVKAFGQNADFINQFFTNGSAVSIEGYLKQERGSLKEDGTRYPDHTYIIVDSVEFPPMHRGQAKEGNPSGTQAYASPAAARKTPTKKPALAMPF